MNDKIIAHSKGSFYLLHLKGAAVIVLQS